MKRLLLIPVGAALLAVIVLALRWRGAPPQDETATPADSAPPPADPATSPVPDHPLRTDALGDVVARWRRDPPKLRDELVAYRARQGSLGTEESLLAASLLTDGDPDVRICGLILLAAVPTPEAWETIRRIMHNDAEARVRAAAVEAGFAWRTMQPGASQEFVNAVRQAMSDPAPEVRSVALLAASPVDPRDTDSFFKDMDAALSDPRLDVRRAALVRLSILGGRPSMDLLWKVAEDPAQDPSMRVGAIERVRGETPAVTERLQRLRARESSPTVLQAIDGRLVDPQPPPPPDRKTP